ncbi:MAG TPA: hypothetical protein GXZ74_08265 [Tissierellia bacterium]|nr:hypothetical protein [Tissierellia bacterium]
MKHFLRLEWQTLKEKNVLLKAVGYLLFYGVALFMIAGKQLRGLTFFPIVATISSLSSFTILFEDGKQMPMRRLLPSLPFSRRDIYRGRTLLKLMIWGSGVGLALLLSGLMHPVMDTWPTAATILIGSGISLFGLSLEHWSIQLPATAGIALRGGLLGGLLGLMIGTGGAIFNSLSRIDPQGFYFGLGAIVLAGLSLWLNQIVYLRRAL